MRATLQHQTSALHGGQQRKASPAGQAVGKSRKTPGAPWSFSLVEPGEKRLAEPVTPLQ